MRAIQISWLSYCYPALLLAYIGQAAFISVHPEAYSNPFFNSVPPGLLYPSLVVAVLAAIVASQAMITACFQVRLPIKPHADAAINAHTARQPADEVILLSSNEDRPHLDKVSRPDLCPLSQLAPPGWHSSCHSYLLQYDAFRKCLRVRYSRRISLRLY